MSKDLTAALQELMQQSTLVPPLPAPKPRGAAPHATGAGLLPGGSGGGGGGGAGNLTEQNYNAREWHPPFTGSSTDGLLWGRVRPVRKIVLTDDGGQVVTHIYARPPA